MSRNLCRGPDADRSTHRRNLAWLDRSFDRHPHHDHIRADQSAPPADPKAANKSLADPRATTTIFRHCHRAARPRAQSPLPRPRCPSSPTGIRRNRILRVTSKVPNPGHAGVPIRLLLRELAPRRGAAQPAETATWPPQLSCRRPGSKTAGLLLRFAVLTLLAAPNRATWPCGGQPSDPVFITRTGRRLSIDAVQ